MTESEAIKELHKIRPRGGIIPQKKIRGFRCGDTGT